MHKKLTLQTSLMMTDTLTKIALSNVFYAQVSIDVLKSLIMRFSRSNEQLVHWRQSFRNIVQTLSNIEIRKLQHKKAGNKAEKQFFKKLSMKRGSEDKDHLEPVKLSKEELSALKMNERLIVNLLERIINIGNDMLAEELRIALLDAYVNLQQTLKLESGAVKYLLSKFGFNIDMMLEQRKTVTPLD